jgi:hypothetical protein
MRLLWWLTLSVALAMHSPASAKDLPALSKLLAPAYTAMNYESVCGTHPSWRDVQPVGNWGTALHYAQHVKDEIIQGLSYQDALVVLRRAADEAQMEVRRQLAANVKTEDADVEGLRLKAWCESHANDFIAAFIDAHDSGHVAFLEQVRALKVE